MKEPGPRQHQRPAQSVDRPCDAWLPHPASEAMRSVHASRVQEQHGQERRRGPDREGEALSAILGSQVAAAEVQARQDDEGEQRREGRRRPTK